MSIEPPFDSLEIESSTPCERCGRPACWLCGDDPLRVKVLCDDCYAQTRHQWFIARCLDCTPLLDQPFRDEAERDQWADEHATIGHHVERLTAVPDA